MRRAGGEREKKKTSVRERDWPCTVNHAGRRARELARSHHVDGARPRRRLAVLLRVAHRLVVVGLVEGVERGVDQVDHQHGVHLAEELAYLGERKGRQNRRAAKNHAFFYCLAAFAIVDQAVGAASGQTAWRRLTYSERWRQLIFPR